MYKTHLIGSTPADNNTLDAEVVVPLKYLSNFWIFLDLPSINCEIELDLKLPKNIYVTAVTLSISNFLHQVFRK